MYAEDVPAPQPAYPTPEDADSYIHRMMQPSGSGLFRTLFFFLVVGGVVYGFVKYRSRAKTYKSLA